MNRVPGTKQLGPSERPEVTTRFCCGGWTAKADASLGLFLGLGLRPSRAPSLMSCGRSMRVRSGLSQCLGSGLGL